jgi:hypothetical protein
VASPLISRISRVMSVMAIASLILVWIFRVIQEI